MGMKNQRGFTIGELMIAVAVAGILLAVGVPAMRTFIQNARITTVTNDMVATINKASSNGAPACMCPTDDLSVATPECVASSNWEIGWIAFSDANSDCVIDAGDVLLKVWDGASYGDEVTVRVGNDNDSINATNQIKFNQFGEPEQANGLSQQGVFSICDDRGVVSDANGNSMTASAVVLGADGSPRSTRNDALIACP